MRLVGRRLFCLSQFVGLLQLKKHVQKTDFMSWKDESDEIRKRRTLAKEQGGADVIARQHDKGRLTIRERITHLVDANSFCKMGEGAGHLDYDEAGELGGFSPANFVLGLATIDQRRVVIGGEDFTLWRVITRISRFKAVS